MLLLFGLALAISRMLQLADEASLLILSEGARDLAHQGGVWVVL